MHLNNINSIEFEYIEWNLNWIPIQLNNGIKIQLNWKEIRCKLVEKVFKICLWIWCWKKNLKKKRIQKYTFPCLLIWEWAKKFQVWNFSSNDVWNQMLSKINQPQQIIFITILILVYNMDIVFSCRCRSWLGEKRGILIGGKKEIHEKVVK